MQPPGAGRYDRILLEAGNDQSSRMLARAREFFPQERFLGLHYAKIGLQEMDFQAKFDGVIYIDALEHVCPADLAVYHYYPALEQVRACSIRKGWRSRKKESGTGMRMSWRGRVRESQFFLRSVDLNEGG
jgi:hypothetical protein